LALNISSLQKLQYASWSCVSAWSTLAVGQSDCCQWQSKELVGKKAHTGLHKSHQDKCCINAISPSV